MQKDKFYKQNENFTFYCLGGVVAYHEALSRLRPGFKSRPGRLHKTLISTRFQIE